MELANIVSGERAIGVLSIAGGFIAASYIGNMVPVSNPDLKNGILVLGGMLIAGMASGPVKLVGMGIAGAGAVQLIRSKVLV